MRTLLSALLFSAVLTTASGEARAAAVVYTFTGSVTDGFDASGVFGIAGRSFSGQAFTARFERDDAVPGSVQAYSPEASQIFGTGPSSPLPVATLTIDGQTHSFGTRNGRQFQASVPCGGCTDDAFGFSADDSFEGFMPSSSLLRSMFKELVYDGAGSNLFASADYHSLSGLGPGDGVDLSGSFYVFDEISPMSSRADSRTSSSLKRWFRCSRPTGSFKSTPLPSPAPEQRACRSPRPGR